MTDPSRQCPVSVVHADGPEPCTYPVHHGGRHSFQTEPAPADPFEDALQAALSALDGAEEALLDAMRGQDIVEAYEILRTNQEVREQILQVLATEGAVCRSVDLHPSGREDMGPSSPAGVPCPHPQIGQPPHCGKPLCPYEHGESADPSDDIDMDLDAAAHALDEISRLASWLDDAAPDLGLVMPLGGSPVERAIQMLSECGYGRTGALGWDMVATHVGAFRVPSVVVEQVRRAAREGVDDGQ